MKKKPAPIVLAMATAALVTGCTGLLYEVNPLAGGPPPKVKPTVLVLGDIQLTDPRIPEPEQTMMIYAFKTGVGKWCVDHHAFEVHRELAPADVPADALVLNGTITEVEKGSVALPSWVGGGAGQGQVKGEFAIHAADGTKLTAFVARRSYLGEGPFDIGGPDIGTPLGMVMELGQLVG